MTSHLNDLTNVGIGVDIEDISRFRELPFDKNRSFYNKIFTKNEIKYCLKKSNPYQHFAARFSAKEAVIKALFSYDSKISLNEIEIVKNNQGSPQVRILKCNYDNYDIKISISHSRENAIAVAIVLKKLKD